MNRVALAFVFSVLASGVLAQGSIGPGTQGGGTVTIPGGTVTNSGTFTAGDLIVGAGGTVLQDTSAVTGGQKLTSLSVPPGAPTYSAACDGSSDDTTPISNLLTAGGGFIPYGKICNTPSLAYTAISGRLIGSGQIKDSATNLRGPYLSHLTAAPSSSGNQNSILTAFNGDISHVIFALESDISGAATLGQPTVGYIETPEAYPVFIRQRNNSGFNSGTATNVGRTLAADIFGYADNVGQGDHVFLFANCTVNSARSGATNFIASPACGIIGGQATALQAGVYLDVDEMALTDNGNDVAAIGMVRNLNRTVGTGALGAVWEGVRIQSNGSTQSDVAFSAAGSGGFKFGIDLSNVTYDSNNAAITVAANQKLYLNATAGNYFPSAVGTTYLNYNSTDSAFELVVGGVEQLTVSGSYVGVVNKTAVNTGDRFGVAGSATNNLGMSVDNSNSGTTAVTTLHLGNSNGSGQAGIFLNGGGFSGGQGANALQIFNTSTAPIVIGTGTEVIKLGTSGAFSANASVATVLGSVGPVGSHTSVQKWLTITDSGGVVGYIPVF